MSEVNGVKDGIDFLQRQHLWQMFAEGWRLQVFNGILLDISVELQEMEEGAHARKHTRQ